jgi:hypothetical protein
MAKKGEKILTQNRVKRLGLDKVSVITADMLDGYTSIGDHAFYDCTSLSSVAIPNSVTSIGNWAFNRCISLSSIKIPDSVTNIGNGAFANCGGLMSIVIPNSVTRIGYSAFSCCSGLTSIIIPNSVTTIEAWSFYCCSGLTSVTIPNSVTIIGYGSFEGCSHLTSVTIGDKTYKTQKVIDGKCKAYKAFNADMTCRYFHYEEGKTYEFDGEPMLCWCGFHACLKLTDVFNHYAGEFGKGIVVYEVELEGVSNERRNERNSDSKVVAKKITIGKRIL